jgi:hypothetical protein
VVRIQRTIEATNKISVPAIAVLTGDDCFSFREEHALSNDDFDRCLAGIRGNKQGGGRDSAAGSFTT